MSDSGQRVASKEHPVTVCLKEIFNWGSEKVELPQLQRDFVWKPAQVERIWDSLVRGFPVGAFLLTPYGKGDKGSKSFEHGSPNAQAMNSPSPEYYLLDGQQRATAIRLASVNPWTCAAATKPPSVLWVDIAPEIPVTDDREFLFRVVTVAHPWGYRRADPESRLHAQQMREAQKAFGEKAQKKADEDAKEEQRDLKGSGFDHDWDLRMVWPIEARKPVPVCLLWQAVEDSLQENATLRGEELAAKIWERLHEIWPPALEYRRPELDVSKSEESAHWTLLCEGLRKLVTGSYTIPVVVLDADTGDHAEDNQKSDKPDSMQTLFLRTQRGGTVLEGEELYYSMIKAEFKNVDAVIGELSHQLAQPSRLAVLLVRLTQLLPDKGNPSAAVLPGYPSLRTFRQWGRDKDFQEKFNKYIPTFKEIFQQLRKLLVDESKDFTLPPVLAVHVFRTCPNVMLVFLYWLFQRNIKGKQTAQLDGTVHRRLLGVLTAVSWFHVNEKVCAERLWEVVRASGEALEGVWGSAAFQKLLPVVESHSRTLCLVPMPPPVMVKAYFETELLQSKGFDQETSALWSTWDGYSLTDSAGMKSFFQKHLQRRYVGVNIEQSELERRCVDAWNNFRWRCKDSKPILLYAQRMFMRKIFPKFDPSVPKSLEDSNTPWDYDHIHAQKLIRGAPPLIKYWHASIGNLRAWPASLNRSDSADLPGAKLQPEKDNDGGWSAETIGVFSAIPDVDAWVALDMGGNTQLQGKKRDHEARKALVRVIVERMVYLYAEWYNTLCLKDLMPADVQGNDENKKMDNSPVNDQ